MKMASVGFHCPECVRIGSARNRTAYQILTFNPLVVKLLIAANVILFVIGIGMGDGLQGQIVADGLIIRGGLNANLGEWYRVVTSGFLHYGFVHLGFNMYALWLLGPAFERSLGKLRFSLFYSTAIICGSFGAMFWTPNGLTVGASGAIFGLLGLATVAQRSSGYSIWKSGLGMVLLLNFVLTFTVSSISVGGHLGGFISGLVIGFLLFELPKKTTLPKYLPEILMIFLAVSAYAGTLAIS
tara:strand:- start:1073 stop:1795 length:723 start_codon:yes stop_codon:yes gene_type:complete